tara:strand:- start:39 stop:1079 length:1041 start_codon:yes stop_codon:yes gene_type:complete
MGIFEDPLAGMEKYKGNIEKRKLLVLPIMIFLVSGIIWGIYSPVYSLAYNLHPFIDYFITLCFSTIPVVLLYEFVIRLDRKHKKRELDKIELELQNQKNIGFEKLKIERDKELKILKQNFTLKFDKDKNGTIDVIEGENEFHDLLEKYQETVISKMKEYNQNYVHQFIKVDNYIQDKRKNIQLLFERIKNVENKHSKVQYEERIIDKNVFINYENTLENEIYTYNLIVFNSLNLITSLINDNQMIFYNIYEKFDKLDIYTSNWEKDMSKNLSELNENIKDLIIKIQNMGDEIQQSIGNLSYVTQKSQEQLSEKLTEINSSVKVGNLINSINTYQNYKSNKNTKSLK